jgi:hypothetical protein
MPPNAPIHKPFALRDGFCFGEYEKIPDTQIKPRMATGAKVHVGGGPSDDHRPIQNRSGPWE